MFVMTTGSTTFGTAAQDGSPKSWLPAAQQVTTDDFLRLLTVQLRYQNPLEPMKETEFVSQLAQFSELEATRNVEALLQRSVMVEERVRLLGQAAALLGRRVRILPGGQEPAVEGIVERLRLVEGVPKLVVGGQEFWLEDVAEVF